jgi:hypothetical protein
MMPNNEDVVLGVGLDTQQFEAGITKITNWLQGSMVTWSAALNIWQMAAGKLVDVANAMGQLAKQAAEADKIARQANVLLVEQGRVTDAYLTRLKALNEVRERQIGIDADAQLQLQTRLSLAGVEAKSLDEATRLAIGLASVTGNDLQSSLRAVEKAYDGNFKALERMGFAVSDVTDLSQLANDVWSAAAKEAETYSGRVDTLNASLGNLNEELGRIVTESGTFNKGLKNSASIVDDMTKAVERGRPYLENYLSALDKYWGKAVGIVSGKAIGQYIAGVWLDHGATQPDNVPEEQFQFDLSGKGEGKEKEVGTDSGEIAKIQAKIRKSFKTVKDVVKKEASGGITTRPNNPLLHQIFGPFIGQAMDETFTDTARTNRGNEIDAAVQRVRDSFQPINSALKGESDKLQKDLEVTQFVEVLAMQGIDMVASGYTQLVSNIASGSTSVLGALGQFFGGIITQLGTMLIQLGTAALLAQALSAIPILSGLAGPPGVSAAVGAGLLAAGTVMVGVGAAMGSGGSGGARGSASATPEGRLGRTGGRGSVADSATQARRAGGPGASSLPSGFTGTTTTGGTVVNNYTVNLGQAAIVGTEAEVGRKLSRLLKKAERLG